MSRHDMDLTSWDLVPTWIWMQMVSPRTCHGAHRAAEMQTAYGAHLQIVDFLGLRLNETTGTFHQSRLVSK